MLAGLRRELLGPAACGHALHIKRGSTRADDAFVPYVDADTGDEVLTIEDPLQRYGLGVLFPKGDAAVDFAHSDEEMDATDESNTDSDGTGEEEGISDEAERTLARVGGKTVGRSDPTDDDVPDIVDTTRRRPSSMAVSFRLRKVDGATLEATLPDLEPGTNFPVNGRYEPFNAEALREGEARDYRWWVRRQLRGSDTFQLPGPVKPGVPVSLQVVDTTRSGDIGALDIRFHAFARQFPGGSEDDLIVTVVLSNHTPPAKGFQDANCLFQAYFEVAYKHDGQDLAFHPLPGQSLSSHDKSAEPLRLAYRGARTYAGGHGCAADWRGASTEVTRIIATSFPTYELGSMTPDLVDEDGRALTASMSQLAGLTESDDPFVELDRIVDAYAAWIVRKRNEVSMLDPSLREQARSNLQDAQATEARMREGIQLVRRDSKIRRAFQLANHAMLLQQIQTSRGHRELRFGRGGAVFVPQYEDPDPLSPPEGRGSWRPFQIGFLLASLASTAGKNHPERDRVDLIWFPTGGGKTEAYLGLTAFSAFLRRIRAPDDVGTDTLMRYTLRLLTAQQYERAASLICAMDVLRGASPDELGTEAFSIGLWVGSSTTSNNWKDAKIALGHLNKGRQRGSATNPFLITQCPWCGCEMGPRKTEPFVLGYHNEHGKVVFRCPDPECGFSHGLPLHVVDEDVYDRRPTLVIGTVDKFARLTWTEQPRALFGLDADGERFVSPPNLIVQDELHLISGPLGTMVGHYETLIEHLCQAGTNDLAKPKIVCSTATVRNYEDQVLSLFARKRSSVFPPPGLDADDSFFGRKAKDPDGNPAPGRTYVGLYAPVLGSHMNVQIRTYAAVLQAAMGLPDTTKDAYWTLMGFFNSLRDLGSTTTLLRDQIRGHLHIMWRRAGILGPDYRDARRTIREVIELTSRLRSEEVPEALKRLERPYSAEGGHAVDTCLASSMIEVGIDVERLGLMVVTGQPKTTSQYIQVTGRVGRKWWDRPGLVVVAYAPSRARDRSVFEGFRTVHEKLYAAVEPTSATPFAFPTIERALHGVLVGYARQTLKEELLQSPSNVSREDIAGFLETLVERIGVVDADAEADAVRRFNQLLNQWEAASPPKWDHWTDPNDLDVLQVSSSSTVDRDYTAIPWRAPTSMRSVDADCEVDTRIVQQIEAAG